MSADKTDGTLRAALDLANPNTLADYLRKIGFGSLLQSQIVQSRFRVSMDDAGADAYNLATLDCLKLPDNAKAASIVRAVDRTLGELTVVAFGATPTTGQIAVSPTGDIVTVATDSVADVDITYLPQRLDVREFTLPVVTNALTIPSSVTTAPNGVILLLEAESLAGTLVSKMKVLVPSASAASTGQARMALNKASVKFAAADAVTRARVKLGIIPAEDVASLLESALTA